MTQGKLQQTVKHYKQQLIQHEAHAEQALEQAYRQTLARVQPQLDALLKQIADKQAKGEDVPLAWLYERNRLQSLKHLLVSQIDHFAGYSQTITEQSQHVGVALGLQSAHAQLQATVPSGVSYTFGQPSQKAIADLVGSTQKGSPLADLFNGFGQEAADSVAKALVLGVSVGDNPRKIGRSVQQALSIPRARALTLVRTEAIRCYRNAALETYRANDDVCSGWVWVTDLSSRSCPACIAMNGTEHDLSEDLNGHPNCRCSRAPKTRSWSDILSNAGIDASGIPDTSIDIQSGSDWFDDQDESVQRSILGSKAAYDLYASGDATLDDFVGRSHSKDWGSSVYQKSVKQLVGSK